MSYYDYYQPESYIAASDTYIEKDASINDEIDKLRHSATLSLFETSEPLVPYLYPTYIGSLYVLLNALVPI